MPKAKPDVLVFSAAQIWLVSAARPADTLAEAGRRPGAALREAAGLRLSQLVFNAQASIQFRVLNANTSAKSEVLGMYDLKLAQIRKQSNGEYFSNPNPNPTLALALALTLTLTLALNLTRSSTRRGHV